MTQGFSTGARLLAQSAMTDTQGAGVARPDVSRPEPAAEPCPGRRPHGQVEGWEATSFRGRG